MKADPPLWMASLVLPKGEAANAVAVLELCPEPEPQAVMVAEDPFGPDATVEALYTIPPDGRLLSRLTGREVKVHALADRDWILQSQQGLAPVRAGRFFVYGAHDAGTVPAGVIAIRIEAGLAFGTGHHETTALCLAALSDLARTRRVGQALDVGCGTGVLSIAIAKLWRCGVIASDIDPVAVGVAYRNALDNRVRPHIRTVAADGLSHPALRAGAPYDLIVANILAGPLTRLARQISHAAAPGGTVILSGLLRAQERLVAGFYRAAGLVPLRTMREGPWSALVLERPVSRR